MRLDEEERGTGGEERRFRFPEGKKTQTSVDIEEAGNLCGQSLWGNMITLFSM